MRRWHPALAEAGVQVGVLLASNPDGDAIVHNGYAALACIKVVALKDRVTKEYDAELLIDEHEWDGLGEPGRIATLDHELSHLRLVPLPPKQVEPGGPAWKLDDLGRPRLKTVPGDWQGGDGFSAVVERHGSHAVEYHNLAMAKRRADIARE